ncbi:MAG: EamA family transporter RarD, partial [Myxococcota bacterium]
MSEAEALESRAVKRRGLALGFGAYLMWGAFPVYWKLLEQVPSTEILAHRVVWSLVFVAALVGFKGTMRAVVQALLDPKSVLLYGSAAAVLSINWGMYIWGVHAGYIVETSLGYFINPLLNVAFGALILGERLKRAQWAAIGLAAAGVLYLTAALGRLPWIALVLAFSFATYSVLKKKATLGALEG